jgi:hypothetical protein
VVCSMGCFWVAACTNRPGKFSNYTGGGGGVEGGVCVSSNAPKYLEVLATGQSRAADDAKNGPFRKY